MPVIPPGEPTPEDNVHPEVILSVYLRFSAQYIVDWLAGKPSMAVCAAFVSTKVVILTTR
eukprot:352461-Rhodomonas_salina.4